MAALPAAPAAVVGGEQQQQPRQQGAGWAGTIIRMMVIYFMVQYFLGGNRQASLQQSGGSGAGNMPNMASAASNLWQPRTPFEMFVYVAESGASMRTRIDPSAQLLWHESSLVYDYVDSNARELVLNVSLSAAVQHNGTLYAHAFLVPEGVEITDRNRVVYGSWPIVVFAPRPVVHERRNLLQADDGAERKPEPVVPSVAPDTPREYIAFWRPNMTINLVYDQAPYKPGGVPPPLSEAFHFTWDNRNYFPVLFFNDFWLLKEHLIMVNDTTPELRLSMAFDLISMTRWMITVQFEQSFRMQQTLIGGEDSEIDEVKRMLLETNPYLLGVTMVVTLLHTVFDFLAFKNDISHWRSRKSMEGLSVKTLFLNIVSQLIILLHLIDNDTSWMVLMSVGVGLLIEMWKVRRAVIVRVVRWHGVPLLRFEDRESYASRTKEFDDRAMRYLMYALLVIVFGYAVYSLVYGEHRGWYSFIVSTLAGCVYTFGFVSMTPQLFINYKMRSVAHLPWRALVYKALNTFIDDLFAFIIRMPTMHRLACLRDDVVFLIYLYQRWIYPVDPKRTNEFGSTGEDHRAGGAGADTDAGAQPPPPPQQQQQQSLPSATTAAAAAAPAGAAGKQKTD